MEKNLNAGKFKCPLTGDKIMLPNLEGMRKPTKNLSQGRGTREGSSW